jgi:hypothetical protein
MEALRGQLAEAEAQRRELQRELEGLRALGVQQEMALAAAATPRDPSPFLQQQVRRSPCCRAA